MSKKGSREVEARIAFDVPSSGIYTVDLPLGVDPAPCVPRVSVSSTQEQL